MRRLGLLIVMVLIVLIGVSIALAFAEEPLSFRDPYSGQITTEEVSSIHYYLTYALTLAAGFSISDSIKLQLWNQLVDSEVLGTGQPFYFLKTRY